MKNCSEVYNVINSKGLSVIDDKYNNKLEEKLEDTHSN